jgi:hypothetical protein
MSTTGWSPGTVPYGADQTVYLVVDRFNSGSVFRETEIERTDLETVIEDFLRGQFNDPVRVLAFNTLEHWANDVSKDIACFDSSLARRSAKRCLKPCLSSSTHPLSRSIVDWSVRVEAIRLACSILRSSSRGSSL